jgi:serine/threonine protein phosphatase PrpC
MKYIVMACDGLWDVVNEKVNNFFYILLF